MVVDTIPAVKQPFNIVPVEWVVEVPGHPEPTHVIRRLKMQGVKRFRVVTWAPTSAGRNLIGYFDSHDDASTVAWRSYVEAANAQHERASKTHGGADRHEVHRVENA